MVDVSDRVGEALLEITSLLTGRRQRQKRGVFAESEEGVWGLERKMKLRKGVICSFEVLEFRTLREALRFAVGVTVAVCSDNVLFNLLTNTVFTYISSRWCWSNLSWWRMLNSVRPMVRVITDDKSSISILIV
jgi:hypothetical protein